MEKTDDYLIVLVDTAGGMQNNIPLINVLFRLVLEHYLDFSIFFLILVGTVETDTLKSFDRFLRSGSSRREKRYRCQHGKRRINSFVLTKFNAVSDKVVAAPIMAHNFGALII